MDELYVKHDIQSAKGIYIYNIGLFIYKLPNGLLPVVFDNFFCRSAEVQYTNVLMQRINISFLATSRGQNLKLLRC